MKTEKKGKRRQREKKRKETNKKSSSRETDTPIAASNEVAIKLIAADLIQRHFSQLKVVSTEQKLKRRDLYSTWPSLVRLCPSFTTFFSAAPSKGGRGTAKKN